MALQVYRLEAVSYPYYVDDGLGIEWWRVTGWVARAKPRQRTITWNPDRTTILSARLHGRFYAQLGSSGTIRFNGEATHYCDATWGDCYVDQTVNVLPLLRNGQNSCSIELLKSHVVVWDLTGIFSTDLIIEYEGLAPNVTAPVEPRPWWELPLYLGLGIGALIAVGYVIQSVRR